MDISQIHEHAEVFGADGVKLGSVDRVEGDRIKLTKKGHHSGHHHFIPTMLVASVVDGNVMAHGKRRCWL